MKPLLTAQNVIRCWLMLLVVISSSFFLSAKAQVVLEVDGGVGYTMVDVPSWAGSEPEDWSQFAQHYNAQVFFQTKSMLGFGINVGRHQLFSYDYSYYYGDFPIYPHYDVAATRVMGLVRLQAKKLFVDFGAGVYMFDDFTDPAIVSTVGYRIPLSSSLGLPIKFNWGLVFDADGRLLPLSITAGLSYRFDKK
jgi:hypothetical protein